MSRQQVLAKERGPHEKALVGQCSTCNRTSSTLTCAASSGMHLGPGTTPFAYSKYLTYPLPLAPSPNRHAAV